MNIRSLFNDDDAVSPVIGVILMVAITVILAAVIASFVLGMGQQPETAPQASFEFDYTENPSGDDTLTVTSEGGEKIQQDSITFRGDNIADGDDGEPSEFLSDSSWDGVGGAYPITAGESATLDGANFQAVSGDGEGDDSLTQLDLSGATIRITWQSSGGETTPTLREWTGPDA